MIVLTLDAAGLVKVEIVAPAGEQGEYHKLFTALRAAIETLDSAVKAAVVKGRAEVAENAHRQ
jgi:hypothetical protein